MWGKSFLLIGAIAGLSILPAAAQFKDQQAAASIITDTAAKICQTAPLESSSQGFSLDAGAKAQVFGAVKKVLNLGANGAAKYTEEKSRGVLERDLASVIKSGNDCKSKVFEMMWGAFFPSSARQSAPQNKKLRKQSSTPTTSLPPQEPLPRTNISTSGKTPGIKSDIEWRPFDNPDSVFGFDVIDGNFIVSAFRLIGTNRSEKPIREVSAYIIPLNGGPKLRMKYETHAEPLETSDANPIPPDAEFSIAYRIPPLNPRYPQGVSIEDYLKKYGGFEFDFEYGYGERFSHIFSYSNVKNLILQAQQVRLNEIRPLPEITKRNSN